MSRSHGAGCRGSFPRSDGGIPRDGDNGSEATMLTEALDSGEGGRTGWGRYFFCKGPDSKYFRLCGSHMVSVTFFIFMTL